ncbi:hypothetical protein [Lysobacter enzymogenes]|uniref:hypothetical protein n=1 Tax=Lysobacter enzymogenes TaxID=69 RepID=UPI000F4B25AA|nr:hypothetical protein [Lysobacter enzymogenes]
MRADAVQRAGRLAAIAFWRGNAWKTALSDAHVRNMNDARACLRMRCAVARKGVRAMARMRARCLNGTETKRFPVAGSSRCARSRRGADRSARNPPRVGLAPLPARSHLAPRASRHDRHGQPP